MNYLCLFEKHFLLNQTAKTLIPLIENKRTELEFSCVYGDRTVCNNWNESNIGDLPIILPCISF